MSLPSTPVRLYSLERDRDRHERQLSAVVDDVETLRDDVTTLKTKVGMYAAFGALGGTTVSGIIVGLVIFFATGSH